MLKIIGIFSLVLVELIIYDSHMNKTIMVILRQRDCFVKENLYKKPIEFVFMGMTKKHLLIGYDRQELHKKYLK